MASAARACAAAVAAEWGASATVTPAAPAAVQTGAPATGPLPVQVSLIIVACCDKSNVLFSAVSLEHFAAGSVDLSAYSLLLVLTLCLCQCCCYCTAAMYALSFVLCHASL